MILRAIILLVLVMDTWVLYGAETTRSEIMDLKNPGFNRTVLSVQKALPSCEFYSAELKDGGLIVVSQVTTEAHTWPYKSCVARYFKVEQEGNLTEFYFPEKIPSAEDVLSDLRIIYNRGER